MSNTIVKIEHTYRNVSNLEQLQLAVDVAQLHLGEAAANTKAAWAMFDDAVDDGDREAKNDLAELAAFCEAVQAIAYQELDEAKCALLAVCN